MRTFRTERFADPTVDFAFKRIFGTPQYKAATIGLLNSLISDHHIIDVEYPNVELISETEKARRAIIDVICTDDTGAQFIVEMQRARQVYFRERMIFYASKLIARQEDFAGDWDYHLLPTYVIAFINFSFSDEIPETDLSGKYILKYVSRETDTGMKMPGSTEYYFLEIARFNKKLSELSGIPEKWLYLLANAKDLDDIPEEFRGDESFGSFFDASERASFTGEEERKYVEDMMTQRDIDNSRRQAEARALAKGLEEGREEGREEGLVAKAQDVARKAKAEGLGIDVICKLTGLPKDVVEAL